MNVARRSVGPARSSALRCFRIATQERALLYRRISTEAVAAAAVAAAALPIAALVSSKLARSKSGPPTTASPALPPIPLPGIPNEIEAFFVDTTAGVSEVADRLWALPNNAGNCLYVDLEGVNLCRHGSVSLLLLYAPQMRQAFVVDVFTLQAAAFTTKGARGLNLQDLFESDEHKKAFFDVRNDSDALFCHYGVHLRGVEDIQLMENASRPNGQRNIISGLSKCMSQVLWNAEKLEWTNAKDVGKLLFSPENGGSFDVFNVRPLSPEIISYCVGDVYYLPRLKERHWNLLSDEWKRKVIEETEARVVESHQELYLPHSASKTRSPWEDEWDWVSLDKFKTPVGNYSGSRSIRAQIKA